MSYIVQAIECHPDRLIDGVYGPFEDYASAHAWAEKAESSLNNFHRNFWTGEIDMWNKKNVYQVFQMEKPNEIS